MLEQLLFDEINKYAEQLETALQGDVVYYFGPTHHALVKPFRDLLERKASDPATGRSQKRPRICLFLKTGGGAVEPIEKMVDITRHHYDEVWFFVPDYAMSAGTIFCMSGDKIFMDYSSSLGPIDPQVPVKDGNADRLVPALGVLEQVEKLIAKSRDGTLTPAEFAILQNQNLALLASYEHAKNLSRDLAVEWLVKYKFKSWAVHRSDLAKKDKPVSQEEKLERANSIVDKLLDHTFWHSHGRMLGAKLLNDALRLEIDDYPSDAKNAIRSYNDLLTDYVEQKNALYYFHDAGKYAEGG